LFLYRPPFGGRLLLCQSKTSVNGRHKFLPLPEAQRGHVRAFSCPYGIYKRLSLCDSLRVKFHDLLLTLIVTAGFSFGRVKPGVEKAGATLLF